MSLSKSIIRSTLHYTIPTLNDPKEEALENNVGKGENAGSKHFLLFPQCFPSIQKNFKFKVTFILWSANAFDLDKAKISSFGKGLRIF